jgi:proteic killer suppression protein
MAIRTFRRPEIADFFSAGKADRRAGWSAVARIVTRKLDMLHYAHKLDDLRSPPANRLEALKGDLTGFFSIRVNDQWRIVFRWTSSGPEDVDVVDYHR